jgi:chromosome segregation ATPase
MRATALWLLLLILSFASGYVTRCRRESAVVNPVQLAAADSALRDATHRIAGLERANAQLTDSLEASDTAIARHRADAERSAERAQAAEASAATIRAKRASAAAGSGASDSLAFYREQLEASERELELLREGLEQRWEQLAAKDSIDRLQRAQLAMLVAAKDSAVADLMAVAPVLEEARAAIGKSEAKCRGPFGIPCPSRKALAIGTVVGVIAFEELAKR